MEELKNYLDKEQRLKVWPSRDKYKKLALQFLAQKFSYGVTYTEKEVNEIIKKAHAFNDHVLLRRELYDNYLLDRTRDCRSYWKAAGSEGRIPGQWETEHFIIRDAVVVEAEELQSVYETSSFMEAWGADPCSPGYILKSITEGDLPPGGEKALHRLQAVRLRETGKAIGLLDFYHGYPEKEVLYIGFFYLLPEEHKKGYGQGIMQGFFQKAAEAGFRRLQLGVLLKNWPALRFWTKMGFGCITRIVGDKLYSANASAIIGLQKSM